LEATIIRRITAHRTGAVWGTAALADRLGADTAPALPGAACTRPEIDPELFFPDEYHHASVTFARDVCLTCPVRTRCLEMFGDLPYGIVAGLTAAERRNRRHPRALPAGKAA
jgi:transcription factor WhiB